MENNPTTERQIKHSHSTFWLSFFLVLVFLLALAVSIYLWIELNTAERRINHLRYFAMTEQQKVNDLQSAVQNLSQPQEKRIRALTEANYLTKLASFNLDFASNVPLATTLLKAADEQLAALNDPTLMNVRSAFATDISALQAAPTIDSTGIILKIDALSQLIPQLAIVPNQPPQTTSSSATNDNTGITLPAWQRALNSTGQALKSAVVIRHLQQPLQPLLPPEQQAYLILNIQLKLSQAEWAVLHQDTQLYQRSLQQVSVWINQYFRQNSAATTNVLAQLDALAKTPIKPSTPSINNSLTIIQNALQLTPTAPIKINQPHNGSSQL